MSIIVMNRTVSTFTQCFLLIETKSRVSSDSFENEHYNRIDSNGESYSTSNRTRRQATRASSNIDELISAVSVLCFRANPDPLAGLLRLCPCGLLPLAVLRFACGVDGRRVSDIHAVIGRR